MLEVLQYYTSSFWVWLGITIGLYVLVALIALLFGVIIKMGKS